MMDTVFSEQFQMGFANSSPWVLLPGFDLSVRLAMAACEVGLMSTDCRRILTPPGSPGRIFPYGITDDDDGSGVYMGVNEGFGSSSQTIIRYDLTSQVAPTAFIDQTDVPTGSAEAVGEITGATFSLGVGAVRSTGPLTQFQQLLVEFDDTLQRLVGEGEGVPGSPGLNFGTTGNTFSTPQVGESTVAFDALVLAEDSANARRGAFLVAVPFKFGEGGGSGAGPAPPPAVVPVILPGEVLPDGTVDSATVAAVSGDVVLSVVRYEEGGTDLYAIYPTPEPGTTSTILTTLALLLTLHHKTKVRTKPRHTS